MIEVVTVHRQYIAAKKFPIGIRKFRGTDKRTVFPDIAAGGGREILEVTYEPAARWRDVRLCGVWQCECFEVIGDTCETY
ncbi:hypothetical protein ACFQ9Z_08265 [Streptomyces sp. NPDC056580]|uniref:hypothetical protein n=1 Tax=Streptomyces sp. NPDC056580 TaxID=3345872 RepID=UPI0036743F6E